MSERRSFSWKNDAAQVRFGFILAIATIVGLTSGCASQPDSPESASVEQRAGATGSEDLPHVSAGPDDVSNSQTGEWDPTSWEPTVAIVAPTLTEGERQRARDDYLAMIASGVGLDSPPTVELVRWTLGPADNAQQIAACLTEAGFAAEGDRDGGISFNPGIPASQEEAFNLATYTCHAKYTLDPKFQGDWTPEQTGLVFDYWDQYFIPCMAAHGYEISRSDMPSRDAYVDNFLTEDRISWWPSESFYTLLTPDEQNQLAPVCPPMPPAEVMYGQ